MIYAEHLSSARRGVWGGLGLSRWGVLHLSAARRVSDGFRVDATPPRTCLTSTGGRVSRTWIALLLSNSDVTDSASLPSSQLARRSRGVEDGPLRDARGGIVHAASRNLLAGG